ncbi:MAG: 2-hydroxyacid dehydrogenase [Alphaproteobacteria bacterium]
MSTPFRIGLSGDFDTENGSDQLSFLDLGGLDKPGVELVQLPQAMTVSRKDLSGLDAFLTYFCSVEDAALEGNDRLLVVSKMAAGYDNMAVPKMTEMGIGYTNTRESFCDAVATAALALLLTVETRLPERGRLMRESEDGWWKGHQLFHKGLPGKKLGLIGPGFIGRSFLRLIEPFGMETIVTGGTVRPELADEFGFTYVDVDTLFREADVVVIACPLNDATLGLASRERLFAMKPGAIIVNVGRGPIIDEDALIDALQSGHLGGAGLDVTKDEPTSIDNPLLHMDNVVVSPHGLANDQHGHRKSLQQSVDALLAVQAGKPPSNLVNPEILEMPRWQNHLKAIGKA